MNEAKLVKRRPLVAAFFNFILPGLGYLYNGQLFRAVTFIAFNIFIYVVGFVATELLTLYQGTVFFLFWGLTYFVITIFVAIDAYRYAYRASAVQLRRFNRWYIYVSVLLMTELATLPLEPPFETYSIPATSMIPNLLVGDYLLAHTSAYQNQPLERGDLVVFKRPLDGTDHVKRIIGLPKDRIQVKGGVLHINGKSALRKNLGEYTYSGWRGMHRAVTQYQETLPNGQSHLIIEETDNAVTDNTPIYIVPDEHYFALGDNRDNSLDSRYQNIVGFIPRENLTGKIILIYFSRNGSASWWMFWRWPQAIRFERIGNKVS
ncbi:MAG: signal peptidase I [Rhodospirillaceae bacterium]|nr:MAG: signal peptidase I [Rhodospirillaceae bacterium]